MRLWVYHCLCFLLYKSQVNRPCRCGCSCRPITNARLHTSGWHCLCMYGRRCHCFCPGHAQQHAAAWGAGSCCQAVLWSACHRPWQCVGQQVQGQAGACTFMLQASLQSSQLLATLAVGCLRAGGV